MSGKTKMILLLTVIGSLQFHCSQSISGVETTNGFSVVATAGTIEGKAPPYSSVFLFDTGYVPYIDNTIGLGTSVDLNGRFDFSVSPGTYNLFVSQNDGAEAGMLQVTILAAQTAPMDTVHRDLFKAGSIKGSVAAAPGTIILVYLAGTGYYRLLSGTSPFEFPSVPAGDCLLRCAPLLVSESMNPFSAETIKSFDLKVTAGVSTETGVITLE